MKLKIITLLLIMALVLYGCGGKTTVKQSRQTAEPVPAETGQAMPQEVPDEGAAPSEPTGAASTLREMFDLGAKAKCTFSIDVDGTPSEGTVWIDGEKFRSETTVNGDKAVSLFDGSIYYAWSEKQGRGIKFSKEFVAQAEEQQGMTIQSKGDLEDKAVDVDCSSTGIISTKLFQPPSDVEFQDIEELMKQMQGMMDQLGQQASQN